MTGYSQEGTTLGGYNWVTIKYLPNGDTAWYRRLNWTANSTDEPFAMTIDKSNNIFITGYGKQAVPYDDDLVTIKYNSNGNLEWTRVISSSNFGQDWGNSISTDNLGNVYINGYVSVFPGNRVTTIKYNPNGHLEWIKYFDTNYGDYLRPAHVTGDNDNNVIANGYYYIGDHYAFNTIKYNSSGDLLWNRIYKGDGNLNFCFALRTDDSSNVYAAGRSTNTGTGADFVTIKYYPNGDTAWINNYDGGYSQFDEVSSMSVDNIHNVYITGRSDSIDGTSSYLTVKYNSNGIFKWNIRFGRAGYPDASTCMEINNNANLIVSGYKGIDINTSAMATIKYSNLTGLQYSNFIQHSNFHINNFPNPYNSQTKINYKIPEDGIIKVIIFDNSGREIEVLTNEYRNKGSYELIFNAANLSSGIYFYSLVVNNKIIKTNRMLLIK